MKGSLVIVSTGNFVDDVMTLLGRWSNAVRAVFIGPEPEGVRFAKLILQILAEATDLEESAIEARAGFPQFIRDVQNLADQV